MNYKIDLFSIFIFLGIVQAIFLSVFFLSKARINKINLFSGILLISLAACSVEIFLMYTGYIINCLYLVDFSEPLSFLIGPLVYLITISFTKERLPKLYWLHFSFALVYLILVFPFYLMPGDVKLNAWIESYKLDFPKRPVTYEFRGARTFWITDHHTLLTLLSLIIYAALTLLEVLKLFILKGESFFKTTDAKLKRLRVAVIQVCFATALILFIKFLNRNDTGDHFFAAYLTVVIYLICFKVMQSSGFFSSPEAREIARYKTSTLTTEQQNELFIKIKKILDEQQPFLRTDFSLPELAQLCSSSVHATSQVINMKFQKSFFEMIADYRVEQAKKILSEKKNLKMEEIAELVGYNSRSSFTTVFKKITGLTPSQYRDRHTN